MKNSFFNFIVLFVLATTFSGCFKDPEPQPCTFEACATKAPASEIQQVKDYLAANNLTATEHCSGLFYRIENAGTGATPEACSNVDAQYKGMFTNGNVFDERLAQFNLLGVITGWTIGVPLIKQGGRIVLYVPPTLGYGNRDVRDQNTGALVIPANSMLIFEINLVTVY